MSLFGPGHALDLVDIRHPGLGGRRGGHKSRLVHGSPHRAGAASARPRRVHPLSKVLCEGEAVGLDDAGEGADVPEGKEKRAALTVVLVTLDQILMYWDRP